VVEAAAEAGAWYVLTHNPVGPRKRQTDPDYYSDDIVVDIRAWFELRIPELQARGLPPDRIRAIPAPATG
jgi:dihydropteroate synthase